MAGPLDDVREHLVCALSHPHLLDRVHGIVPPPADAPLPPGRGALACPPRKLPDARLYGGCVRLARGRSYEPQVRAGKSPYLFGPEPATLRTLHLCKLCRQGHPLLLCPLGAPACARFPVRIPFYRCPDHPATAPLPHPHALLPFRPLRCLFPLVGLLALQACTRRDPCYPCRSRGGHRPPDRAGSRPVLSAADAL